MSPKILKVFLLKRSFPLLMILISGSGLNVMPERPHAEGYPLV